MSGFMDKMMSKMGFGYDEYDDDDSMIIPKKDETVSPIKKGKVVNINTTTQLKVVVIQPTSYSESQDIADHLKSKKPVVVNLEKIDKDTAKKVVDFLSGAVYALDGSMQKVSNGIILLAPYNVGIMGDFSSELKSTGIFDVED